MRPVSATTPKSSAPGTHLPLGHSSGGSAIGVPNELSWKSMANMNDYHEADIGIRCRDRATGGLRV